ncbi:MAG: FKBP-type peptidyl-prolyl cis-trans isomerase [Muribaculaceae bacterium]|nr:FKBP-type peptidyl-prolyl cis-trans isomerase [Muribaculaceae bacterium]
MKQILYYIVAAVLGMVFTGCLGNSVEDEYKSWREANDEWFAQQQGNTSYYTTVTAAWDPRAQVLMHWFNDTMSTRNNARPLFSSTVDVKYRGMTKDDTPFDSSYLRTSPADSIFRVQLSTSSLVEGWPVAITRMHVGDSCRVVVPYTLGYGSYKMSDVVLPYTNMVFDIKLVDIYAYETH